MNRNFSRPARCLIGGVLGLILISAGGCATRSQVTASNEISVAMFAIRDAEASGAETYAIEELQQAMALVKQAGEASGAEAERLAEQALVYAQLANATASRESARQQLMEAQQMDQEAKALKQRTTEAVEERLR